MLFVGDDWAEDHHDVELQDDDGRRLARARLPEGVAGIARLHALIAEHLAEERARPETGMSRRAGGGRDRDRPRPVGAGAARGRVSGVRDQPAVRRPGTGSGTRTSGAKSDAGDAHVLADMVRTDCPPAAAGRRGQPSWPRRSRWWPGRTRR